MSIGSMQGERDFLYKKEQLTCGHPENKTLSLTLEIPYVFKSIKYWFNFPTLLGKHHVSCNSRMPHYFINSEMCFTFEILKPLQLNEHGLKSIVIVNFYRLLLNIGTALYLESGKYKNKYSL